LTKVNKIRRIKEVSERKKISRQAINGVMTFLCVFDTR